MDIEKLKTFCLLADHNSYVAVSKIMDISRSNISKMIEALESELGVALTFVQGKKILLTKEGRLLYPRAKNMVYNYKNFISLYKKEVTEGNEFIKINTTNSYSSTWLPPLLRDFNKHHKDFSFEITGTDSTPVFFEENIDVAIRPYIANQDNLIQKRIKTFKMSLRASEAYIEKKGMPQSIEDLKDHQIISFDTNSTGPFNFFNWHLQFLPSDFKPFVRVNSGIGMMKMVENGLGIAPVSHEGVELSSEKLITILPDLESPSVDIFFIYQKYMEKSEKIKLLCDFLVEK